MNLSKFVEYVKVHATWKNKPDKSTPVDAASLMKIESGIKSNNDAIKELAAAVVNQIANDPDKIASMAALYAVKQQLDQQNSDFANRLSAQLITGQRIIDKNYQTGIYLMLNPTDAWRDGYFAVIVAADANIALCLNDGALRYRSAGGVWSPVS